MASSLQQQQQQQQDEMKFNSLFPVAGLVTGEPGKELVLQGCDIPGGVCDFFIVMNYGWLWPFQARLILSHFCLHFKFLLSIAVVFTVSWCSPFVTLCNFLCAGEQVKGVFQASGLPTAKLAQIW